MTITLDDQYQITTDPYNFMLQKRRPELTPEGETKWDAVTYHHDLTGAVHSYIDKAIKASDAKSLSELALEIESIKARVREVLLPLEDKDWQLSEGVEGPDSKNQ